MKGKRKRIPVRNKQVNRKAKNSPLVLDLARLADILKTFKSRGNKDTLLYLTLPGVPAGKMIFNYRVFGFKPLVINPEDKDFLLSIFKERSLIYSDLRENKKFQEAISKIGLKDYEPKKD